MQGTGNDYIYVNCLDQKIDNPGELAVRISDRHFGIGGDGLVLILPSEKADFKMRIFNADGSEAEMCGNATRCVGKYCYDKKLTGKNRMTLETLSGLKHLDLSIENNLVKSVRVGMGKAIWPDGKGVYSKLLIEGKTYRGIRVSVGNPHFVIFVDRITDNQVLKTGKIIENHPFFPNKTNVEFARIINREKIHFRVWERGSGETLSCGTGACAVSAVAYASGLTNNSVKCILTGGELEIDILENDRIFKTGPAESVFEGSISI